jgi:hypothetical protein
MHYNCIAQKEIVYSFESCVIDSLQGGISMHAKLYNKAEKELNFYAVLIENNNEFEIFLQVYSDFPKSGLLELIESTNRKIKMNKAVNIPIIILADKMSMQIQKEKIAAIPLSGYYIKVVYENYRQKVVQTSIAF